MGSQGSHYRAGCSMEPKRNCCICFHPIPCLWLTVGATLLGLRSVIGLAGDRRCTRGLRRHGMAREPLQGWLQHGAQEKVLRLSLSDPWFVADGRWPSNPTVAESHAMLIGLRSVIGLTGDRRWY
ncbi:hypothetical protein ACOMHN_006700 [Nucella lapillus]